MLYFGVVGFVGSIVVGVFHWQRLGMADMGWMGLLALTGVGGHLLLIKALQLTPAVILQPFSYFLLVWAIVIGYFVYGERLDQLTVFGAVIVVASGLFIAWRGQTLNLPGKQLQPGPER